MPAGLTAALTFTFMGFIIFVLADSQQRFKILKENNPEEERSLSITHAFMMTLLVMLTLYLFGRGVQSIDADFPPIANKLAFFYLPYCVSSAPLK